MKTKPTKMCGTDLFPRETGGRIAQRGFYYQNLYVLRLLGRLVRSSIDGCVTERGADFLTWKCNRAGRVAFNLIEIKYRSEGSILDERAELSETMELLASRARELRSRHPRAFIRCTLVFNYRERDRSRIRTWRKWVFPPISAPTGINWRMEPFLAAPISIGDLQRETRRIFRSNPALHGLFKKAGSVVRFVENLMGITMPFFAKVRIDSMENFIRDKAVLGAEFLEPTIAHAKLREAINAVLNADLKDAARQARAQYSIAQESLESLNIGSVSSRQWRGPARVCLGTLQGAAIATVVRNKLESTGGILPMLQRFRGKSGRGSRYYEKLDAAEGCSLAGYLERYPICHWRRIALLLSFAERAIKWNHAGVSLSSKFPQSCSHWFVREDERNGMPTFITGDTRPFNLIGADSSLWPALWQPASLLASVMRTLYYGPLAVSSPTESEIGRQSWNDNVVWTIAQDIESRHVVNLSEFKELLDQHLGFCLKSWPVFVSEIDEQFIRDALEIGFNHPFSDASQLHLGKWLVDRSQRQANVIYFQAQGAKDVRDAFQIGLVPSHDDSFGAYRIFRYNFSRWASHQGGDKASSREAVYEGRFPALVGMNNSVQSDVIREIFNIDPQHLQAWLRHELSTLGRQHHDLRKEPLLDTLMREAHIRRSRLDKLQKESFSGQLKSTDDGTHIELFPVRNAPRNISELEKHLEDCGYSSESRRQLILKISRPDYNYERLRTPLGQIDSEGKVTLENPVDDQIAGPEIVRLWIEDKGLESVLGPEDTVLKQIQQSIQLEWESPALHGFRILRDALLEHNTLGSSNLIDIDMPDADRIARFMDSEDENICIITGAPGTGKTRLMAGLTARFLDASRAAVHSPHRVLVVANTHFALENFIRAFLEDPTRDHVIMRPMPSSREDKLLGDNTIDAELTALLKCRLESQLKNCLPTTLPGLLGACHTPGKIREFEKKLTSMRDAISKSNGTQCSVILSGHERWRRIEGNPPSQLAGESTMYQAVLQNTIDALAEVDEGGNTSDRPLNLEDLKVFAAEIVAVSVDGFMRTIDTSYDLILFEEASQLSLIGVTKVLTKVFRAAADEARPVKIIFSGDSKQLPPYRDEQLRDLPFMDFFLELCRSSELKRITLADQYRMHPNIGELVRQVSYPDEQWAYPQSSATQMPWLGVWWVDNREPNPVKNPDSKSSYDDSEVEIVINIWHRLRVLTKDVLVVTPYSEQAERLKKLLPESVKVCTIDGCQGIGADAVIVSFVRFDSEFTIDPRRINVALSRAKRWLFCIGSFAALEKVPGNTFRRLHSLFLTSGDYADRLLDDSHFQRATN